MKEGKRFEGVWQQIIEENVNLRRINCRERRENYTMKSFIIYILQVTEGEMGGTFSKHEEKQR
jgi:hypothetical protein